MTTSLNNEQREILKRAREELCKLIEMGRYCVHPTTEEFKRIFDLVAEIEDLLGY